MNRSAKGVRVAGGLLLFVNLAAFFLPVTKMVQEPYYPAESPLTITPLQYIMGIFKENGELFPAPFSTTQLVLILCFLLLPVLLSLAGGIIGIVGSTKQLVSGIFSLVIAGLYGTLFPVMDAIWPEGSQIPANQEYMWGYALYITLGVSAISAVLGVISFFVRPKKPKKSGMGIPEINEMRQEQELSRYHIVEPMKRKGDESLNMKVDVEEKGKENPQKREEESVKENPAERPYDPSHPRGVMVGLSGIYAGAEIPFRDEEAIKLGRLPENDLVFADQTRVSRKHCVLIWHAAKQRYEILDYSSNGSYINGEEECLPQNLKIDLAPGTILDIGDSNNRFRLE